MLAQQTTLKSSDDDRIAWVRVSSVILPLANPISDAKVLTGRQKPMTEIAILFAEIETIDGHRGLGFSYSKRAGGPGQFAHAQEVGDDARVGRHVEHGAQRLLVARRLLHQFRIEKLLVVDDAYRCIGLITVKDIEKAAIEGLFKAFTDQIEGGGAAFTDKTLSLR